MKKKQLLVSLLATVMVGVTHTTGTSSVKIDRFNKFVAEYTERSEYIKAGSALNKQMAEEGMVLLKNKDNMLPLTGVSKVSVFGKASTNLQYGGGGSGSGSVKGETQVDLQKSLEDAGYELNPKLTAFYKDNKKSGDGRKNGNTNWTGVSQATIGETPLKSYTEDIIASYDEYNDAAVVLLARGGTEGADCKTIDARDDNNADLYTQNHYLELSKNEQDMFKMVEEHFDKIIVLINSGNIFQCDYFENNPKIGAVIWMGTPGAVGAAAVGEILNGTVNPSGRTVDTWTRNFKEDPSFQNFADNSQTNIVNDEGVPNHTMINADGTPTSTCTKASWVDEANKVPNKGLNGCYVSAYVSYEEGVYVDYRYYETKYADMEKERKGSGDTWYASEKGVIYPFGYGLSYTSFSQSIKEIDVDKNTVLTGAKKNINLTVTVKNEGDVAGKDVVQVYWKAPYKKGGIEKPYEVLCAFGKTEMLEPGEEQDVKLSFCIQDVASYDYDDKNHNGFKGYELDGGTYGISINKNAHEAYEETTVKVQKKGIKYETDRYTGHKVENRFSNNDFYSSLPIEGSVGFDHMSREDFDSTFPSCPTIEDRTLKADCRAEEFLTHKFDLADIDVSDTYEYVPAAAHYTKDTFPADWTQQKTALKKAERTQLSEMIGVDYNDPLWDEFLNEFTYAELQKFVEDGTFNSPSLDAIGKRSTRDSDGPCQYSIIWWVGAPTVAATYNVDLATKQGQMVGTEAHISDQYGWLGPAVNIHRSPFGGRNFEYYSADPFLMGRMAACVVREATAKGVYAYFKHFVVNDQEKNREGTMTFVSEQALREIYLRPFQMVVQEGKATGIMSSYNRLGMMETAASYPLLTEVLREEWGFKGAVMSDMTHHGNGAFDAKCYENINNRALSGCNAQLDNSKFTNDIQAKWDNTANDGKGAPVFTYNGQTYESYSWWYAVRMMAKGILYNYANSGGMSKDLALIVKDIEVSGVENGVLTLNLNEEVNKEVTLSSTLAVGETYNGKEITEVNMYIDPLTPLPEGLEFEDGVIKGTATKVGEARIHVLVDLKLSGQSSATVVAQEFKANVVDPNAKDVEKKSGGCGGSIIAISSLVGSISLLGTGLFLYKKKKEEN